jgi:iron(III) transport system permease protein
MWLNALINSSLIYGLVLAMVLPWATLVALVMMRTHLPGRRIMGMLLFAAMAIPVYVQAGAWNSMFGQFGWWTLTQVGAAQNGWSGPLAIVVIQSAYAYPWVVICLCFGLSRIDRQAEEAAWMDVGIRRTLLGVTFPLLIPYILFGMLIVLVLLSTDMTVTNLYRFETVTERFYQQASAGELELDAWWMPLIFGLTFLAMIAMLHGAAKLVLRVPSWRQRKNGSWDNCELRFTLGSRQLIFWSSVAWGITAFWVLLPLFNLVWNAGWSMSASTSTVGSQGRWSISHLLITLARTPVEFGAEFGWSLYLAICSATIWLGLAISMSYLPKLPNWVTRCGWVLLVMLVFVPGPWAGLLAIGLWNRSSPAWCGWMYDHTLLAPITALGARMLPLAIFGVALIRSKIPSSSWEMARIDGVSMNRLLTSWYLRNPRLLVGVWLVLVLLSIADLSSVLLVLPPGVTPISVRIFELLHYGVRYQESGICLILALFSLIGAMSVLFLTFLPGEFRQILGQDSRKAIESRR